MSTPDNRPVLEEQIARWREHVRRRGALSEPQLDELEGRLRHEVMALTGAGLTAEEALLIAVKRTGNVDARFWKQLVVGSEPADKAATSTRAETVVVFSLAIAAGLAIKVPELFGLHLHGGDEAFYARNASLF